MTARPRLAGARVVLVRTEVPGNIGSAARVMRNFGLEDLVLVAPVADRLDERARQMATHHAIDLLQRARVVGDLEEALADCVMAAATSSLTGGLFRRQTVGPPDALAPLLVEATAAGPVALVFGPEPSGLSNEEVLRCQHLIHIPASADYAALNLAQAVAICAYELHRAWQSHQGGDAAQQVATYAEQDRMFGQLQEALTRARYLRGVRGEALMHALRHLVARARPSPMEVRLLHGLARQINWVVDRADLSGDGPSPEDCE